MRFWHLDTYRLSLLESSEAFQNSRDLSKLWRVLQCAPIPPQPASLYVGKLSSAANEYVSKVVVSFPCFARSNELEDIDSERVHYYVKHTSPIKRSLNTPLKSRIIRGSLDRECQH